MDRYGWRASLVIAFAPTSSVRCCHPARCPIRPASTCKMVCTVEQKVSGVIITSSPSPTPSAASATCSPRVRHRKRVRGLYVFRKFSSNCAVSAASGQPNERGLHLLNLLPY